MTNNKKGVLFIVIPPIALALTLSTWAIAKFVLANTSADVAATQIINVFLSLLGLVSVLGIAIGIPFGIYLLSKKDEILTPEHITKLQQQEKYLGFTTYKINFIHKWSWGAFFGTFIWAIGNKLYLWAVFSLIPIVNIYPWIKLSVEGRKMAWEQQEWQNFDQFKKRQSIVAWVIGILIILSLFAEFIPGV